MLVDQASEPVASVIIPAFKSAETISRCLESLCSQKTATPYEVIVAESSGDGAGDIVRTKYPQVQLIESPVRLLSGAARNAGARIARGKYLLFIDSDCIAEPEWVEKMCNALRSGQCSAAGGAIINGNPETATSVAAYISEFSDFFPFGDPRYMNYLVSSNSGYNADVFRSYGGFFADVPLYVDLMTNRRLFKAGEKLLFDPNITVRHLHRYMLKDHLSHQMGRGRAAAVARRKGLLPGASLVRYPALAVAALPVLFAKKVMVFPFRFARAYPIDGGLLIRAMPQFLLGMLYWHYGFLKEILSPSDAQPLKENPVNA